MDTSFLTAETIGMEKFSPSALDCYEQCPRLFYYQNWLGLKIDEDKMHMDFGTAIHEAIGEVYLQYDQHFGGGWQAGDFEKVKERFLMYWKPQHVSEESFMKFKSSAAGRDSDIDTARMLYEYMKEDGFAMLESYWEEKEVLLKDYGHDLVDFEMYKKFTLFNPENESEKLPIPISMRIDARTRDHSKIVDFKTSKGKYNYDDTKKKIQGQLYLLQQWCESGKFSGLMDYTVLRKGLKRDERIEVTSLIYDEADIIACFYRVQAILARIANREFAPPQQGHASYCQCRKYEELLNVN